MADPVWWLPDGWGTAHVIRPDALPNTTLCGRRVGDRPMVRAEDAGLPNRCGQCRRRDPFYETSGAQT